MFDLSLAEFLVVGLVALLVIGPEEMPQVVRSVAKAARSLRYWVQGIKQQVMEAVDGEETLQDLQQTAQELGEAGGKRFILDDAGNYREVYDLSEFVDSRVKVSNSLAQPSAMEAVEQAAVLSEKTEGEGA